MIDWYGYVGIIYVLAAKPGIAAKTLMFVNASPADYNVQETDSSLLYAGRVKTVKNTATKGGGNSDEIKKLQKQLAMMKKKLQEKN